MKVDVAAGPLGVPLIAPVDELSTKPVGSDPLPATSDHVYGIVPPDADTPLEYAVPTVPAGSDVVVIVGAAGEVLVRLNVAGFVTPATVAVTV